MPGSEQRVYHDAEWEHGLRCGNEGCDFLFAEGDPIYESPESMFEDGTPVVLVICWRCALVAV